MWCPDRFTTIALRRGRDRRPAQRPRARPRTHDRSHNAEFTQGAQGLGDLPVGKSEPGEPITETAVRELYEETGLTVEPGF